MRRKRTKDLKIRQKNQMLNKKTVIIYTDGACSGNPGPGGWGAVLMYGERKKELSGGEEMTTNNRMELTAVISALNNTGKLILTDHIDHCIIDAVKEGDQEAIDALKDAIDKFV